MPLLSVGNRLLWLGQRLRRGLYLNQEMEADIHVHTCAEKKLAEDIQELLRSLSRRFAQKIACSQLVVSCRSAARRPWPSRVSCCGRNALYCQITYFSQICVQSTNLNP